VAFSDEQMKTMRQELGLAEDADETAIMAAFSDAQKATKTESPGTPEVPEGMSLVESDVLASLKSDSAAGRAALDQLNAQARDAAIEGAIKDGKITPARRDHWTKSWAADAEGTKALLDSLDVIVPTQERGTSTDPDQTGEVDAQTAEQLDAYGASLGLPKGALHG
jgi:hypothetical protein